MPSRAVAHKQTADDLYRAGQYRAAIAEYDESLEADADQPDVISARGRAFARLGEILYNDGKLGAAKQAFDTALAADDNQPAVHFARGRALQKVGQLGAAEIDFKKADPENDGAAAAALGYNFWLLRNPQRSAPYFARAIELGFRNAAVLNDLAYCQHLSADYVKAEDLATTALELSPNLRAAFYNRGMSRLQRWIQTRAPETAEQCLEDLRETISRGESAPGLYYCASMVCAGILNDRLGDPKTDPLYEEGAEYLRLAAENGCPRNCLENHWRRLSCMSDWVRRLPQNMKVFSKQNGIDQDIRIVDPFD